MAVLENDERTVKLTAVGAHDKPADRRITLLLYHEEGLETVSLVEGQSVVVGRASPAQVTIPHPSLSRQHARFEMTEGQVWVEDLGSTNGTKINGELVSRAQVGVDQDVILGTVTVSVHAVGYAEGFQLGLAGHDRFIACLEQEIVRQRTFGRKLGLLIVQAENRRHGELRHWVPRVKELLRPVDQVSLYSPSAVEIAVPEATLEELQELARQVTTGGASGDEPTLLCGLGLYPDVAASALELLEVVRTAANRASTAAPVQIAEPTIGPGASGGYMVQCGPAMQKVYASVDRLAKAVIPVLIVGETGSGKEVIAQAIHEGSPRRDRPLRCINCAAIPRQLTESTMFGHEKGAFTGADRRSEGIFREADGGTVLLDEIGELSAGAQAALLRALETKRIMRVGSSEEQEVDVRVLAATHRDLDAMCCAGDFRLDLLYRINAVTLVVPPLRERPEEIEPLARHFLEQACQENGFGTKTISPEALEALQAYSWPGNVRELRNVIHRAVVMGPGGVIGLDDLPERLGEEVALAPADAVCGATAPPHAGAVADSGVRLDYKTRVQNYEIKLINEALAAEGGNKTAAAVRLGLPLRTLSYKMKTLGIEGAK